MTTGDFDANEFMVAPGRGSADSRPLHKTDLSMIDLDRVREHIRSATERGRLKGPTEPLDYLVQHKCLVDVGGHMFPTLGGIVCFGQNPQDLFPAAVVDLGHYYGTAPLAYEVTHIEKDIDGTIFDQLNRVEQYLWSNIHHGMTTSDDSIKRVELHEYPRTVIRELSVNMVAHRDYTNYLSTARIHLFKDRIEWISPGGLPEGITIENLLAVQCSRNPVILRILYQAGYVEAFGQGLDTVVALLQQEGMGLPRFEDIGASFIVTVYGKQHTEPMDDDDEGDRPLTETQKTLLAFISTRGEARIGDLERIDTRTRRSIQRDLQRLMEARLIASKGETHNLRYYPLPPS